MVHFCAVFGCGHKAGKNNFRFFRFPSVNSRFNEATQELQKKRRAAWIAALKRADISDKKCDSSRVCCSHFHSGEPAETHDCNSPDWIPSINLGYRTTVMKGSVQRHERSISRHKKTLEANTTAGIADLAYVCDDLREGTGCHSATQTCEVEVRSVETQTDLVGKDLKAMEEELINVNRERYSLREKLSAVELTTENFERNDVKVTFYTGLPSFPVLIWIFKFVSPFLNFTATSSLDKFQQLILTLMKLRLNLSFTDLGYRFNISSNTVSRIFYNTLDILDERLHFFLYWPDRDELRKTMPQCFQNCFGKSVVAIIDCFEIFIERPSNLEARCQTWSAYKHHHTVKYLIGISPQGVASFISDGWGGRASDKQVTEGCGFLNKLLPGDVVLADRGFNIAEEVGLYYATVNIPAFTRGKHQLDPKDIEETRKIASVRIHVERVIGTIRQKYSILSDTIPMELLVNRGNGSMVDKIVRVCCKLLNTCKSVVPFD